MLKCRTHADGCIRGWLVRSMHIGPWRRAAPTNFDGGPAVFVRRLALTGLAADTHTTGTAIGAQHGAHGPRNTVGGRAWW